MQSSQYKAILFLSASVLAALLLTISLFTADGNVLGRAYFYLCIGAALVGLGSPKVAVYALLFCSGYIDHFKRLMIVYGNTQLLDVAYIQAIPVALLCGAIVSTLINLFFRGHGLARRLLWALGFILAFAIATLASSSEGAGGVLRRVQSLVNQGLYPFLLIIVPVYFKTAEEMRKVIVYFFVLYIPVALYMFRHHYLGLADFEYDYLMTGLSQEARILTENNGALRGFSTMSGSGIVSVMMSIMVLLCFVPMKKLNASPSFLNRMAKGSVVVIFAMASYFTVSRGGWFCGIAAISAYVFFNRKISTVAAYGSALALYITLVCTAPYIQKHRLLEQLELTMQSMSKTRGDVYLERAMVLGTANDRLSGLVNLTQMQGLWTPFGWKFDDPTKLENMKIAALKGDFSIGHDMVVDMVIGMGYIPMILVVFAVGLFLVRMHGFLLSLPRDSLERKVFRLSLALALGILFGGFGNAAQTRVFPLNFFIWLFLSFGYTMMLTRKTNTLPLIRVKNAGADDGSGPTDQGVEIPSPTA